MPCKIFLNTSLCVIAFLIGLQHSASAEPQIDYTTQIKPLLAERCFACHGSLKQESNLRLDSGAFILAGGDSGEIVVPGHADQSLLIEMITSDEDEPQMPPAGEGTPLKPEEVELLKQWINQNAIFPPDDQPEIDPREYWSYQPVARPEIPTLENSTSSNPIDAFIDAQLAQHNLTPVQPAAPETLLRRIYLDLIGLPPTEQQIKSFLSDPSDAAYEKVVDTLLASPQYGERWGRHWMDVWRYSDWYGSTAAKEIRNSQYHIWQWRDWIVESLNADKGYDSMLHEMLAADELAPIDRDALRATGYLGRSWYLFNRTTWLIDTVEHASMAFLGITMKCARCHDHKYDPIQQTDYYRFRAIFEPHDVRTDPFPHEPDVKKIGLPRVYDKQPDAPTYLFIRGDERSPDKENPLAPNIPEIFNATPYHVSEISLPLESRIVELQPEFIAAAEEKIKQRAKQAKQELATLETKLKELQTPLTTADQPWRADVTRTAPRELFQKFDPAEKLSQRWDILAGKWNIKDQRLVPDFPGSTTAYLATKENQPENFYARLVYRPTQQGTYRSIGFSFDLQQPGDSQDIYTSTGDKAQSVQAFHRLKGKDVYPLSGVVKTELKVGAETTVEVVVRGRDLRIWLNDELKLDYLLPKRRQAGKFAAWVYAGTAEFSEIEIHALEPTPTDQQRTVGELKLATQLKRNELDTNDAELSTLRKRVAAVRAKYQNSASSNQLAIQAEKAEKHIAYLYQQNEVSKAEHFLNLVANTPQQVAVGQHTLQADAEQSLTQAITALKKSANAMIAATGKYQPFGEPHPEKSTGRRAALARWLTDPSNPRTARIAVNHLWLRHFGRAIVPTVTDFGVRSQPRSHPLLFDWLATELMQKNWQMKPLHKLMVMSQTYRRSSAALQQTQNAQIDGDNVYLWRMNSRRLEAEAIRDSILYTAGKLDQTLGGPTLPQTEGHTTFRRSMYYQLTPDNKMDFLAQFDVASPLQCYQRKVSVVPQQALALSNSVLAQNHARHLAGQLQALEQQEFINTAFLRILSRQPSEKEQKLSQDFLSHNSNLLTTQTELTPLLPADKGITAPADNATQRARENFIQVLFSHNDFVTIR